MGNTIRGTKTRNRLIIYMENLINFNGQLMQKTAARLSLNYTFFKTGRLLAEKLRFHNGKLLFSEFHYFHLMASMRKAKLYIPMIYTPENFEQQILRLLEEKKWQNAMVSFNVMENKEKVVFYIDCEPLSHTFFYEEDYEIDLYREAQVPSTFFDNIPFLSPIDSILEDYAKENELSDLILQNNTKNVARTLQGSLFVIKDTTISTPNIENGARDTVLRNKLIETAKKAPEFDKVEETGIFPFSVTRADEMFVAIEGKGVQSVSHLKKSKFTNEYTKSLVDRLLV